MPQPIDGHSASRQKILDAMQAVKNYAALSDGYQQCIGHFIALREAQADNSRQPLDKPLIFIESHRVLVSEENKKRAADRMRVAIEAFNEYGSECPDHP